MPQEATVEPLVTVMSLSEDLLIARDLHRFDVALLRHDHELQRLAEEDRRSRIAIGVAALARRE